MKVAIITAGALPVPPVKGGAVEATIDTIVRLNESFGDEAFDITVYSPFDQAALDAANSYKVTRVVYLQPSAWLDKISSLLSRALKRFLGAEFPANIGFLLAVMRRMKNEDYDVVVVHNRSSFIPWLRKCVKGKLVLYLHNDYLSKDTFNAGQIVAGCDYILCNSNYIRCRAISAGVLNTDAVITLHNPIDVQMFAQDTRRESSALRESLGIPPEAVVVAFAGRIQAVKGVKELVEAFTLVNDPSVYLLICGSSWYELAQMSDYVKSVELAAEPVKERVRFTGYISHKKMPVVYGASDILVVPSMWEEPAGKIVTEAMAARVPVIISDSGGMSEYVDPAHSVTVARGASFVTDIAGAIKRLVNDSALRARFSEAGFSYVQRFDHREYIQKYRRTLKGFTSAD